MKTTIFGSVLIAISFSVPLCCGGQVVCPGAADR